MREDRLGAEGRMTISSPRHLISLSNTSGRVKLTRSRRASCYGPLEAGGAYRTAENSSGGLPCSDAFFDDVVRSTWVTDSEKL